MSSSPMQKFVLLALAGCLSTVRARRNEHRSEVQPHVLEVDVLPNCQAAAPSTFPGGCNTGLSRYACFSTKETYTSGNVSVKVQWACSDGSDQGRISAKDCRDRSWEYKDGKTHFSAPAGIYDGACEFGAADQTAGTSVEYVGTTPEGTLAVTTPAMPTPAMPTPAMPTPGADTPAVSMSTPAAPTATADVVGPAVSTSVGAAPAITSTKASTSTLKATTARTSTGTTTTSPATTTTKTTTTKSAAAHFPATLLAFVSALLGLARLLE